jgi:hypothetical protein
LRRLIDAAGAAQFRQLPIARGIALALRIARGHSQNGMIVVV